MEISFCHYCRREIYFGPREQKHKDDLTAVTEVWRHKHSENAACDMVYATPVQEPVETSS